MTDIVEQLRAPSGIGEPCDHSAMRDAADEIERLRTRVAQLDQATNIAIEINNDHVGEIERLSAVLAIIAGEAPPVDYLLGNADLARTKLS